MKSLTFYLFLASIIGSGAAPIPPASGSCSLLAGNFAINRFSAFHIQVSGQFASIGLENPPGVQFLNLLAMIYQPEKVHDKTTRWYWLSQVSALGSEQVQNQVLELISQTPERQFEGVLEIIKKHADQTRRLAKPTDGTLSDSTRVALTLAQFGFNDLFEFMILQNANLYHPMREYQARRTSLSASEWWFSNPKSQPLDRKISIDGMTYFLRSNEIGQDGKVVLSSEAQSVVPARELRLEHIYGQGDLNFWIFSLIR